MLLGDVFDDLFDALDAGAPAADQAEKDVVGDVGAELALAHVLVQFSQGVGDLDEESI